MRYETKAAVTQALDAAITSVARERLQTLKSESNGIAAAEQTFKTLDSFRDLGTSTMPKYNSWDALLYLIWYQPVQINLAYTLAQRIPTNKNPLRSGSGSLQVVDFACGAFATRFGLALAATDAFEEHKELPQLAIVPVDESESMKEIGRSLWQRFIGEIENYPELKNLRIVCEATGSSIRNDPGATRWLTALHVAYKDNPEPEKALNRIVDNMNPEVVLVTTHPNSSQWLYSPKDPRFARNDHLLLSSGLSFQGDLRETTEFRCIMYHDEFFDSFKALSPEQKVFVEQRLTVHPTRWASPIYRAQCITYER